MRTYTIVNMYMQGIHAGIQSAHIIAEMAANASNAVDSPDDPTPKTFYRWAEHEKTLIVLNGGSNQNLRKMIGLIKPACRELYLPFAEFHESQEALDGALTGFGLVVPSRIYQSGVAGFYGTPEDTISSCLNLLQLAR